VANPELRSALISNNTLCSTLDRDRADIALIGIGGLSENSNRVRMGWFSPQEVAQARLYGTVGDMMGLTSSISTASRRSLPCRGGSSV